MKIKFKRYAPTWSYGAIYWYVDINRGSAVWWQVILTTMPWRLLPRFDINRHKGG
jgi:hypothetical protein